MLRLLRLVVVLIPVTATSLHAADTTTLPSAWKDLLSQDETTAARAILTLASTPKETIDFLRDKLPCLKADKSVVLELVKQLGDRDYHTREGAHRELLAYGSSIREDLEQLRQGIPGLNFEAQDRLRRLLGRIRVAEEDAKALTEGNPLLTGQPYINYVGNQPRVFINGKQLDLTPRMISPPSPPLMDLRSARAIVILEHIGTPEAARLLESLADGGFSATSARLAQASLVRLKVRK